MDDREELGLDDGGELGMDDREELGLDDGGELVPGWELFKTQVSLCM
jgi:hypothetical protein